MVLDIDIKRRAKRVIYSRIIWIVLLNIILIIVPIFSYNFLRSRDSRALRQRSIATNDISRTIRYSVYLDLSPKLLQVLPIAAPHQRIILLESDSLKPVYDTLWMANEPILSYEYHFFLNKLMYRFFGGIKHPTLDSPEIISRMEKYIKSRTKKFSIINYRYLYSIRHFTTDKDYSLIVLTDKSDLMIDSKIGKALLILTTCFSLLLGLVVSIVYYLLLIRPLTRLTKSVEGRRSLPYSRRSDEIGKLSRAFKNSFIELEERNRSFEEFTNDILHEIKNPLTSIRNATELIESDKNRIDIKKLLQKESGRIEKLLYDIKEYNSLKKEESYCLPGKIIEEISEIYFKSEVRIQIDSSNRIKLPEKQFVIILTNLLDNAISFSPEAGSVLVKFYSNYKNEIVEVIDNGPGITNKDQIFNRYYSRREDDNKLHSGLGLTIIKKICDLYDFEIECLDNKPKGTIFRVTLS